MNATMVVMNTTHTTGHAVVHTTGHNGSFDGLPRDATAALWSAAAVAPAAVCALVLLCACACVRCRRTSENKSPVLYERMPLVVIRNAHAR